MNFHNLAALPNLTAHVNELLSRCLPELTGAELGILEFLNERGLHMGVFLRLRQGLLQNILQNSHNGQALHPLGAPVGGDVPGMTAPELFRVALKEHGVKLFAKAVDVEILQRILVLFAHRGVQVAEARIHGGEESHIVDGVPVHFHGVVKKLLLVVDSGNPVPGQHDPVFLIGVRAAGGDGDAAA